MTESRTAKAQQKVRYLACLNDRLCWITYTNWYSQYEENTYLEVSNSNHIVKYFLYSTHYIIIHYIITNLNKL